MFVAVVRFTGDRRGGRHNSLPVSRQLISSHSDFVFGALLGVRLGGKAAAAERSETEVLQHQCARRYSNSLNGTVHWNFVESAGARNPTSARICFRNVRSACSAPLGPFDYDLFDD